jgi:CHAP domain
MKLSQRLVELAKKEVGVEEIGGTNCGPRVNEYKAATWLPPDQAWPWCAAFIDWLVMRAMEEESGRKFTFERPRTAGAWDMENWSMKQDGSTWTKLNPQASDIAPGDIVIFTFSHVGLAIGTPEKGMVETIEGNTDGNGSRDGGGVWRKQRKLSLIRSRIRFTV